MEGLPKQLRYNSVKPRGFAQLFKQLIVNPLSSFNQYNTNEMIRFMVNTDGFIDPYRSYV